VSDDGVRALLATLPILVILVLMLGRGWSAARAGVAGVVVALAVAVLVFRFPAALPAGIGVPEALGGILAESGFAALTILWIIGPALGIHQMQLRTGAAGVLRSALGAFAPDPQILALLVAWFFVLFMEGAAGFGSSVALAAPFLVAAGFRPVAAVTIALVGHVVGVSFGAIGTPVMAQVVATGLGGGEIARETGIYHSVLGWLPLAAMLILVRRGAPVTAPRRPVWGWAATAFLCFAVPYTLLWSLVGPELPTLGGALFGGVAFVLLLRRFGRPTEPSVTDAPVEARPLPEVLRAAAPYLVLVGLVLLTRLVPPLRDGLQGISISWELGGAFSGSMQPLYHPGTMLLLGFAAGALLQRASARAVVGAVADATRRLVPVAVALTAMLVLARTMVHAGMTEAMAVATAAGAGGAWPALAPFVGVLGTFVTGSATASNILFTDFQRETALALGLPVAGVVGAQGFGAAVGNMICPHNVVAAGATVGLAGSEGEILRRTTGVALAYTGLGGLLAWWMIG
jgi:lactate permease